MKYKVISQRERYDLAREVEYFLKRGWRPQGGVSVKPGTAFGSQSYAQALVKDE